MQEDGIQGKICVLLSHCIEMLEHVHRTPGKLIDTFSISAGVLQGEILSRILFSVYLNDFERRFIK